MVAERNLVILSNDAEHPRSAGKEPRRISECWRLVNGHRSCEGWYHLEDLSYHWSGFCLLAALDNSTKLAMRQHYEFQPDRYAHRLALKI